MLISTWPSCVPPPTPEGCPAPNRATPGRLGSRAAAFTHLLPSAQPPTSSVSAFPGALLWLVLRVVVVGGQKVTHSAWIPPPELAAKLPEPSS